MIGSSITLRIHSVSNAHRHRVTSECGGKHPSRLLRLRLNPQRYGDVE
jgi:hypothetical protein